MEPTPDRVQSSEYDSVCERKMGVHRTYAEDMYALWNARKLGSGSQPNATTGGGSLFCYVDDGRCKWAARGVDDATLQSDNGQPCDSFKSGDNGIYCGGQGS